MDVIGRYRIVRQLGEGGMGVVYEAHDERLGRTVAVKLMRDAVAGPHAVERFWREARAAAINHPHICQIYELGEDAGRPFIVMERLVGETLAQRLARGALPAREAGQITLSLLDALAMLHERQIVHRDLKPSNVFLTAHGIKLLDFGLARDMNQMPDVAATRLTSPGMVMGTPHYMAPEQVTGERVDAKTDLFAAGAILFEMLSGHPAFGGDLAVGVLHKVLHEQPPALVGSPLVNALDAIIHRALAKSPASRYATADAMATHVREALLLDDHSGEGARITTMTRLVVLPFRLLRPDPDTEFLAFSLPDALTASLSAHDALSVRSPLAASPFMSDTPDLRALAEQLDVDHVLTGTLMRSGNQLRISVQLLEAPGGRVMWSHGTQASLDDLFALHDELCRGVCEALPIAVPASRAVDAPSTPRAYELYLRANQLGLESSTYRLARSLYERCLEEDPHFAPAWARLGRIHRVIGKYLEGDPMPSYQAAEEAFQRALTLNPDLPLTHHMYAYLETEVGRAEQSMTRVLARLRQHPANADLLAALVHSCRYSGLLDASVAAHDRARRLDPQVRTSVLHTWFMMGNYQRAVDESHWLTDPMLAAALVSLGRLEDARVALGLELERFAGSTIERHFIAHLRAFVGGTREEGVAELDRLLGTGFRDGEGIFYAVRSYARLNETEKAIAAFARVLEYGFFCYPAFARDSWLDPLRSHPRFVELLRAAEARHRSALRAFEDHGGPRLLGVYS